MNYDSGDVQKNEAFFEEYLNRLRNIDIESLNKASEKLIEATSIIQPLIDKPDKTEEELLLLQHLKTSFEPIMQQLNDAQLILGEDMFRQSEIQYQNIKNLAENGDEKAKEVFEQLHPLYQQLLREKMGLDDKLS